MVVSQQATNAFGLRRLCWDRGAELISVETEADVSLIYEYMNLFYGDAVSNSASRILAEAKIYKTQLITENRKRISVKQNV